MEVVIMVGLPASGKKEYAKKHYPNYTLISLSQIPNYDRKKEQGLIVENLEKRNSIVIADINASEETRAKHISLAKKYNAKIICVHLDYPIPFVLHRNKMRKNAIPESAIYKWNSELNAPSYYEGFEEIIRVSL